MARKQGGGGAFITSFNGGAVTVFEVKILDQITVQCSSGLSIQ